MSILIKGSTNVPQPDKTSFVKGKGERNVKTFKGSAAEMTALYNQYKSAGMSCDLEKGPVWTLTLDELGEEPEYSWEVLIETQAVDILVTSYFGNISMVNRAKIRQYFNNPDDFNYKMPAFVDDGSKTLARSAWYLKFRGEDTVTVFIPVMRTSYVVTMNYEIPTSTENVDVVHTKSTMIAIEKIPSRLWGTLADSYSTTFNHTTTDESGTSITFTSTRNYGWLKGPPQVSQVGFDRVTILQEYRYAGFAQEVYCTMI